MKTAHQHIRTNHHWTRTIVLRAALAACSLAGFLLATGAQSHWT